jgi:hypothetical protein
VRVPPKFLKTSDFDAASAARQPAIHAERRGLLPGRGRSMASLR